MFFHPQHPRSVENFDIGFGGPETPMMTEKAQASRRYPAYQLPGLTYEMRPNGSVAVLASRNKRAMDAVPQDEAVSAPNKKRRLVTN
jgi:hypothetical protein